MYWKILVKKRRECVVCQPETKKMLFCLVSHDPVSDSILFPNPFFLWPLDLDLSVFRNYSCPCLSLWIRDKKMSCNQKGLYYIRSAMNTFIPLSTCYVSVFLVLCFGSSSQEKKEGNLCMTSLFQYKDIPFWSVLSLPSSVSQVVFVAFSHAFLRDLFSPKVLPSDRTDKIGWNSGQEKREKLWIWLKWRRTEMKAGISILYWMEGREGRQKPLCNGNPCRGWTSERAITAEGSGVDRHLNTSSFLPQLSKSWVIISSYDWSKCFMRSSLWSIKNEMKKKQKLMRKHMQREDWNLCGLSVQSKTCTCPGIYMKRWMDISFRSFPLPLEMHEEMHERKGGRERQWGMKTSRENIQTHLPSSPHSFQGKNET